MGRAVWGMWGGDRFMHYGANFFVIGDFYRGRRASSKGYPCFTTDTQMLAFRLPPGQLC